MSWKPLGYTVPAISTNVCIDPAGHASRAALTSWRWNLVRTGNQTRTTQWLQYPAKFVHRHIFLNGLFLWLVAKLLINAELPRD